MILTNDNKNTPPFSDMSGKIFVWFMCLVCAIVVLRGDRLVFGYALVIENSEVDLVALRG